MANSIVVAAMNALSQSHGKAADFDQAFQKLRQNHAQRLLLLLKDLAKQKRLCSSESGTSRKV